ncbi:MAG: hypothetical protein IKQ97_08765 [Eubacterium sp.]|nr:hypothetical protein [Eubacterium sp.]
MNEIEKAILIEEETLKQIKKKLQHSEKYRKRADDKNTEESRLVAEKRGKRYIYRIIDSDGQRSYVKENDMKKAINIAQRDFNKAMSVKIENRLRILDGMKTESRKSRIEETILSTNPGRLKLIDTFIVSDDDYAIEWQNKEYISNSYPFDEESSFLTNRGERVRSKSEKILADYFFEKDIPYRYEPELCFENGKCFFPDFILLNKKTKKEYVWEHFGMMDDSDYSLRAVEKILEYAKNGYVDGVKLICTYETSSHGLQKETIDQIVAEKLH